MKKKKKIFEDAIQDYKFIKDEINTKLQQNYTLEEISKFLIKFKGIEITSFEEHEDYAWLDFNYNNVNTYVGYEDNDRITHVSKTFEIYNPLNSEYFIEDYLTLEDYEKYLKTNKEREEILTDDAYKKASEYNDKELAYFIKELNFWYNERINQNNIEEVK